MNMDDRFIALSDAVAKLLSEDNKDKSLGEVSEELNSYIVQIKDSIDSGDITYDRLRDEIFKHLKNRKEAKPGSLAQLLIGCTGDTDTHCPMRKEEAKDISFIYDEKNSKLIPMTRFLNPLTEDTYAIIYFTGNPGEISIDSLKYLEDAGFKKVRLEYKEVGSSSYKSIDIENLKRYIDSAPEKENHNNLLLLIFIMLLVLVIYSYNKN